MIDAQTGLREPPADSPQPLLTGRIADRLIRASHRGAHWLHRAYAWTLHRQAARRLARTSPPYRLCLGSGRAPIPAWTNVDLYFNADVQLDLRSGIPIPDRSASLIYSEHLIEHLPLEDAMTLFAECFRVLSESGVMRIATPDLGDIVKDYQSNWRRHSWVNWPQYEWVDSGGRMLNTAARGWGHQYLYDLEELRLRLEQAGFRTIERCQIGESPERDLRGLETRADSTLVVEARR